MKFNIGDRVWQAHAGQVEIWVKCPHCFGKKFLTVVLGESKVTIDCAACQRGFDAPTGRVREYQFQVLAIEFTIDRIEVVNGGARYNHHEEQNVFATQAEAQVRAEQFRAEHDAAEKRRMENLKENAKRTWAWNATYHRSELKSALRKVEYHTAKLSVAKRKSKED